MVEVIQEGNDVVFKVGFDAFTRYNNCRLGNITFPLCGEGAPHIAREPQANDQRDKALRKQEKC